MKIKICITEMQLFQKLDCGKIEMRQNSGTLVPPLFTRGLISA